jgi:hypothetical protein
MPTKPQGLSRHPLRGGKQLVRGSALRKRTVRKLCACALLISLLSQRPLGHGTAEIGPMLASERG